jgi:hypothetical protein
VRKKHFWLLLFSLFFLLGSSLIQAETIKLKVVAAIANLRLTPDLGSRIVGTVSSGKILESAERIGDWFKVSLPPGQDGIEITGYIHIKTVEVQAETPRISKNMPIQKTQPKIAPLYVTVPQQKSKNRLAFKLTGGFARLQGGDASANRTGFSDYWKDKAQQPGSGIEIEGGTQEIHSGMNFEADVIYYLNSRLGVGIGASYILVNKGKDQSRMVIRWPGEKRIDSRGNSFSAIPIKLGVFFNFLKSRKLNFFLNGGVGYYLARWKELEDYESESPGASYWKKYETKVHSGGIGFHGGLGLEYRLLRNVSFVLEGSGRYARISGFKGEYNEKSSEGADATDQGKLYYYEWAYNQKLYPWIELLDRDPSQINFSDPIYNAREAVIDFSGFSVSVGIKFSL